MLSCAMSIGRISCHETIRRRLSTHDRYFDDNRIQNASWLEQIKDRMVLGWHDCARIVALLLQQSHFTRTDPIGRQMLLQHHGRHC